MNRRTPHEAKRILFDFGPVGFLAGVQIEYANAEKNEISAR